MKKENNIELKPYDRAIAELFFLLAEIRYKHDLPLILDDLLKYGKYSTDNEDLNFKGTIIAPYSLITNGYAYNATRLEEAADVLDPEDDLESLLLYSKQNNLQFPSLLNNDGAIALTKDGKLAAAHVLYDGLIWNMIDDMQKRGTIKDKQPFDDILKKLTYNGDGKGSTRRANALAAAYLSDKNVICMDQTPYFPKSSYKGTGLPRITVYNGKNGQSAILYFSNDKRLNNTDTIEIHPVLRLFKKQGTKLEPDKTIVAPLDELKRAYINYLKQTREEDKASYLHAA